MHGTPHQKTLIAPLEAYRWDACFCATEPQAGTDLTAVALRATPLERDIYAIDGEKVYISAGMHELTENTLYFVLGRIDTASPDSFSLSCLVVPRFWPDEETGELQSNHVDCIGLPRKMARAARTRISCSVRTARPRAGCSAAGATSGCCS